MPFSYFSICSHIWSGILEQTCKNSHGWPSTFALKMKHPKNQTKSFKKSVMNALHFFHFKQQKSTYRRGFFFHAFFWDATVGNSWWCSGCVMRWPLRSLGFQLVVKFSFNFCCQGECHHNLLYNRIFDLSRKEYITCDKLTRAKSKNWTSRIFCAFTLSKIVIFQESSFFNFFLWRWHFSSFQAHLRFFFLK